MGQEIYNKNKCYELAFGIIAFIMMILGLTALGILMVL
jgi:hypothetical protein